MRIPTLAAGIVAAGLVLGVAAPAARAEDRPFGIGLIVGSPTGLSLKLYLNKKNAIDAAIGGELVSQRGIAIHADYLWHPFMITEEEAFYLPFYFGIGGRILNHDRGNGAGTDVHLGARVPAGILFDFKQIPLDVFLEGAVILDLVESDDPRQWLDFDVGIGARYYF